MKKIKKFFRQSIISVDQFDKNNLLVVFDKALYYKRGVEKGTVYRDLAGKIVTALFYEPSSRTIGSFIGAAQRLGAGIIPIHGVASSSVVKGETFSDTVKIFQSYSDCIVIRHPDTGAAKVAANIASVPIINAGDGTGEHPTQALLDLFTIKQKLGRCDNLKVAMVGDLKYGRTVHSLSKLISNYKNITLYFIAPPQSPMPDEIIAKLKKNSVTVKNYLSIEEIISKVDVLYMTRVQKERMEPTVYEKIKNLFILDKKLANKMKKQSIIMHPLPRVGEITVDVDDNPRSVYLNTQMRNGLFVRMALLKLLLTK